MQRGRVKVVTVAYELGNALYLNITNRCSNSCSFCVRNDVQGIGDGINLWLTREPTVDEVVAEVEKRGIAKYTEIVFCGYGEPMLRAYDVIAICKKIKAMHNIPIRINTNGQANMICGEDITPQLAGWVDAVAISLNAKDGPSYQAMCQSDYGEAAFEGLLDFAVKCKRYVPQVTLSVVAVISEEDIKACREIARRIGVDFRVRGMI